MAKYAYIAISKYQSLTFFKGLAQDADEIFFDLIDSSGRCDFSQYYRLLKLVKQGDTVVLHSLFNISSNIQEMYDFLKYARDEVLNLILLDKTYDEELFLSEEGFHSLETLLEFEDVFQKDNNWSRRVGRPSTYPENFYLVFIKYKSGSLKAKEAAEELNIPLYKFYNNVKEFS
ncbi:hypothetical protein [Salipaludibacillus sp. CF4.18]|uniref:hypothetical protein n=1 Tax=Salipaludibacillus sp. CF4.18 TaxID=3373081 RepID=UPI003EE7860E